MFIETLPIKKIEMSKSKVQMPNQVPSSNFKNVLDF